MPWRDFLPELASCSGQIVEEMWSLVLRRLEPMASLHVPSLPLLIKLECGGDLGSCVAALILYFFVGMEQTTKLRLQLRLLLDSGGRKEASRRSSEKHTRRTRSAVVILGWKGSLSRRRV